MTINYHKITLRTALLAVVAGTLLVAVATMLSSQVGATPVQVLDACNNASKVCSGTDKNSLFGIIKNGYYRWVSLHNLCR